MAGAGPVSEKLPSIVVPEKLIEGGSFLKWDDIDASCSIYILKVDRNGHVLSWKPEDYSKDTEVLEMVYIRDVRTGQYARSPKSQDIRAKEAIRTFCVHEHEANAIAERTVTIVYGPNMVDLTFINFVASSIAEAVEWTDRLFKCTNNLLEVNASPLKSLERFYTKISVQGNQDGEIPARLLVKHFVTSKDDKKRAYDTLQNVGLAAGKQDTIKVKDFTFEKFSDFFHRLVPRKDLDGVFAELGAKKKPYLTLDQLVEFLNNRQRDPRLNEILYPYYNNTRAQAIISCYEKNKDFANKGYISIEGLTSFLMSDDNPILLPEILQIHQDLTFPMAHYFINSSHNTYLTGHQLTGKSSVEIYRQVLLAGCRCIELDCWDGKPDENEPIITHGMTLCTEVPFKEVIEAIAESAFKTSEYPVVLSFENHCSARQQQKMASYCIQIFGDMLLSESLDDFPLESGVELPSPKALKRKILIKNKKRVVKESKSSNDAATEENGTSVPEDSEASEPVEIEKIDEAFNEDEGSLAEEDPELVLPKSEQEEQMEVETQQELSELVNYFQPVHFKGFDKAAKASKSYEMSSFSENAAMNLLKESPVEFVNYNKFQPSRIYPKGKRINSDNYNPQLFWNAGCQFVALNFQTLDIPMMLNLGKFEVNGRCGYLLKPEHMRRKDRTFDPFVDSMVDGVIAGTVMVRIISGQCLSERKIGTYVDVEMFGIPADIVRKQYRTKVVSNNGLNPVYDEEPFKFKVILPQLAVLRICVYDDNGKLIGHRILPVVGLSPGFRHIKLRNECYQPLGLPTLFVEIVTKDYVPEGLTDLANALTNPMKYLSEKEKRTKQLEALIEDQDKDTDPETEKPIIPVTPSSDLNVPASILNKKRGSVVSLQGIMNKEDPIRNNGKDNGSKENRETGGSISRVASVPSKIPDRERETRQMTRSVSQASKRDAIEIKAASIPQLENHKVFLKLKSKQNSEMQSLIQKHAKDRSKINKKFESETKKLKSSAEKKKSTIQKEHSKTLKKAEKEGLYNDVYTKCMEEINELNENHEKEIEQALNQQSVKLKEIYLVHYEEQMSMAKSHIGPRITELRKVLTLVEEHDKKRMITQHGRDMATLKNAQDVDRTNRIKELAKEIKDQAELVEHRKMENKKHVEQSVKERQKLQDFQEKEIESLEKEYREVEESLTRKGQQDMKELEELYNQKLSLLETQDLRQLVPILLTKNNVNTSG